jgi:hypothetical protein
VSLHSNKVKQVELIPTSTLFIEGVKRQVKMSPSKNTRKAAIVAVAASSLLVGLAHAAAGSNAGTDKPVFEVGESHAL